MALPKSHCHIIVPATLHMAAQAEVRRVRRMLGRPAARSRHFIKPPGHQAAQALKASRHLQNPPQLSDSPNQFNKLNPRRTSSS